MEKWSLDSADILVLGNHRTQAHPGGRIRELEVVVTHRPTGISIKRTASWARYTRKDAQRFKEAVVAEVTPLLEDMVAKLLKIPGR